MLLIDETLISKVDLSACKLIYYWSDSDMLTLRVHSTIVVPISFWLLAVHVGSVHEALLFAFQVRLRPVHLTTVHTVGGGGVTGCAASSGLTTRSCISCWPIVAHRHDAIVDQNIVDLLYIEVNMIMMVLMLVAVRAHVWPHATTSCVATLLLLGPNAVATLYATVTSESILTSIKLCRPAPRTCWATLILIPS